MKANRAQNDVVKSTRYNKRTRNGSHLQETAADGILPSKVERSLFSAPAQKQELEVSIQKEMNECTSVTLPTGLDDVYEAPL